jgi:GntR family transcriptional regulator
MENVYESIKLDKNIPIPLYYQLKKQILTLIESAAIKEGDLLPTESNLCISLNVSRPTIRQAFSELVNEGYLNRYKGKGTYVSKPKIEDRFFSKLESFNKEMTAKGFKPKTKVLVLEKRTGPLEANERRGIPLDAYFIYLSRLRFIDNTPLVYLETYLPYESCKALLNVDFKANSLYDSLETLCNIRINRARREITAINASKQEAELLKIAKNKALSLVKTVAYSGGESRSAISAAGSGGGRLPGNPVEFSIARYSGDLNQFTVDVYC